MSGSSPRPRRSTSRRQKGRSGRSVEDPEIPGHLSPAGLDAALRRELRSLPAADADLVSLHLQAASEVIDEDPELALAHSRAARRIGARVAAVREAVGIAAYRTGAWREALAELRTAYRMYGDPALIPMLADCERGLGRPERALDLLSAPPARGLTGDAAIERVLVEAGARRDIGQVEAARLVLERAIAATLPAPGRVGVAGGVSAVAAVEAVGTDSALPRMWYAYADTLTALGRSDAAEEWFAAVTAVDPGETTDAAERAGLDDTATAARRPGS